MKKWLIDHTTNNFQEETRFWKQFSDEDLDGRIKPAGLENYEFESLQKN